MMSCVCFLSNMPPHFESCRHYPTDLVVCAGQPRSPLPEALHPKAAAQAAANAARVAAAFQQQRPIGKLTALSIPSMNWRQA